MDYLPIIYDDKDNDVDLFQFYNGYFKENFGAWEQGDKFDILCLDFTEMQVQEYTHTEPSKIYKSCKIKIVPL